MKGRSRNRPSDGSAVFAVIENNPPFFTGIIKKYFYQVLVMERNTALIG